MANVFLAHIFSRTVCAIKGMAGLRVRVVVFLLLSTVQTVAYGQPLDRLFGQPRPIAFADPTELASRATVYRDTYGVPHIYAQDDDSLYFAFGYAHAQDHLEAMLQSYRIAAGTMAEVFGPAHFSSDRESRLFRYRSLAVDRYGTVDPRVRRAVESFVLGINAYIEQHPGEVPAWAGRAEPVDPIALLRYIIISQFILQPNGIGTPTPGLAGCNAWALGPPRSGTGRAMLYGALHFPWSGPLRLYEAHLVTPLMNVSGATFLGIPFIMFGHNQHIAWTHTLNKPDVVTPYAEQTVWGTTPKYVYGDELRNMYVKQETIAVNDPDGPPSAVVDLAYTSHGPVVSSRGMSALAVRVSGFDEVNFLLQWYLFNRATNLQEFEDAASRMLVPVLNTVYADTGGTVYHLYNAKLPRKSGQFDWNMPVAGWLPFTEWVGFFPFHILPRSVNPPCGYVLNCNNAPWFLGDCTGIFPMNFPVYLSKETTLLRAQRAANLIGTRNAVSLEEMLAFAWDTHVLLAERAVPIFQRIYELRWRELDDPEGHFRHAMKILSEWNRSADTDQVAVALFRTWWLNYLRLMPDMPPEVVAERLVSPTPQEEEFAMQALAQAVNSMVREYGRVDVPWGRVHRMKRGQAEFPVSGCDSLDTLHQVSCERNIGRVWYGDSGDAFIMVVHLSNPVEAYTMMPFGNSANPDSVHYADQASLFSKKMFKPAWYRLKDILSNLESVWGSEVSVDILAANARARISLDSPANMAVSVAASGPTPSAELKPVSSLVTILPESQRNATVEIEFVLPPAQAVSIGQDRLPVIVHYDTTGVWSRRETDWDATRATARATCPGLGTYGVFVESGE